MQTEIQTLDINATQAKTVDNHLNLGYIDIVEEKTEEQMNLNQYAENLKKIIQQLEREKDRIEDHIRKQTKLLEDLQPPSRIKLKNKNETSGMSHARVYSEDERLDAVRAAVDSIGDGVFERKHVLEFITDKRPDMYRDTEKDKTAFSNDFWRVIRDLIQMNKIKVTEKGGGRKATKFAKI